MNKNHATKSRSPAKIHRPPRKSEQKTVRSSGSSLSAIYLLPDKALEVILNNLSYEEIIKMRLVCKWFYYVIGRMLNDKFLSLSETIDDELSRIKSHEKNVDSSSYSRILRIIKSEVRILEAHCLDYVESGVFFFYGGLIFDFIDAMISTRVPDEANQLVAGLFVLVEDFLNNFDVVAEPRLLDKSLHGGYSWFGRKLIDCLDCYSNFEFDMTVSLKDSNTCRIFGSYSAKNVASMALPPVLLDKNEASQEDLNVLLAYIRRHVRWNNLLNYLGDVDGKLESYDIVSLPGIHNSNITYSRQVRKCDKMNELENNNTLNVTVDVKCHKALTPLVCRDQLFSLSRSDESVHSSDHPKLSDYKLDLTLEIVMNNNNDRKSKIVTFQVCQCEGTCSMASHVDTYRKND